jgi:CheY-like chemotaxis protein
VVPGAPKSRNGLTLGESGVERALLRAPPLRRLTRSGDGKPRSLRYVCLECVTSPRSTCLPSASGADRTELKGVRVLVVEDHWHIANALRSLLVAEGLEVSGPAGTAAAAGQLAARDKPELAVVDINLKGEMAYDLIAQLHDQGVRVVVVSGYALLPRLTEKVVAVLPKPINGTELVAALRRALSV